MGRQVFTAGEILTAANMNDLGDQTVMVFDDATARTTAIPTPVEGMTTYLKDTDLVEVFDGSDFVPVAIEPPPAPAGIGSNVVQSVKTNTFATSSTTFVTITDMTVTITPTLETSKILVMGVVSGGPIANVGQGIDIRFVGGNFSTLLTTGMTAGMGEVQGAYDFSFGMILLSGSYIDSPNTTSPTTYSLEVKSRKGGTIQIGRNNGDNTQQRPSLIAMEVAG